MKYKLMCELETTSYAKCEYRFFVHTYQAPQGAFGQHKGEKLSDSDEEGRAEAHCRCKINACPYQNPKEIK